MIHRKKTLALLLLALALFCDYAAAQQAKLSDPHADPAPARRKTLSDLTDSVIDQLPPVSSIPVKRQNFIDDFVFGKMDRDKIPHAGLTTDTEFLRRVNLDLTGRLPEPEAIRKFVADKDPEKRNKLIDSLMATTCFAATMDTSTRDAKYSTITSINLCSKIFPMTNSFERCLLQPRGRIGPMGR
jgi:hypothetical protein